MGVRQLHFLQIGSTRLTPTNESQRRTNYQNVTYEETAETWQTKNHQTHKNPNKGGRGEFLNDDSIDLTDPWQIHSLHVERRSVFNAADTHCRLCDSAGSALSFLMESRNLLACLLRLDCQLECGGCWTSEG